MTERRPAGGAGRDPVRPLLGRLLADPRWAPNIAAVEERPPRAARHADWPAGVCPEVIDAAVRLGFDRPYSHQAEATRAALEGRDVLLCSGTASGKSLAYLVPVLNSLARRPEARALMLFPTKALARDQLAGLHRWAEALPDLHLCPAAYDGDTPPGARPGARRRARVLLTNPDMLHAGILPRHTDWSELFRGLELVVLDEAHAYRGVFGSHVANVVRRLRRIARFHGSRPRFVLTSATIGNPAELARALVGRPFAVVADDGSPSGARTFALYNPPVVDAGLGIRRSSLLEAEALARHFLGGGVQTIVFAQSRQAAELVVRYLSDAAPGTAGPAAAPAVRGYRSGYTPNERREIEHQLRTGQLRAVVATNALELGIDIGQLDACVIAGYPGSIASARQQAGRAGRRSGQAAVVLVASGSPIDQFLVRHPRYLFGGSPEHALVDPDNLLVLLDHVRCAAAELPFGDAEAALPLGDEAGAAAGGLPGAAGSTASGRAASRDGLPDGRGSPPVGQLLEVLAAKGDVRHTAGTWYWIGPPGAAAGVSLRSAGADVVTIVTASQDGEAGGEDVAKPGPAGAGEVHGKADGKGSSADVLGTIERSAAPRMVHPGAIYLHDGRPYQVVDFRWQEGRALVQPADGSEYTRASARTDLRPVAVLGSRSAAGASLCHGELEVHSRVTGYRRIRFRTHETLGWGQVNLPEQVHVAGAYWFMLDDAALDQLRLLGEWRFDPAAERGADWPAQRARALERDGHRCRLCNAPERHGRTHDVHHVRPYRSFGDAGAPPLSQANDLDNLITLCHACHVVAERALGLAPALGGLGHAVRHMAALLLMCDARDIDVSAEAHAPWTGRPTVAVYERAAGGVGFGPVLFDRHEELLAACRDLIEGCTCPAGCPSCVGPTDEHGPSAKRHALAVLAALGAGAGAAPGAGAC